MSGTISPELERDTTSGRRPRADYVELAKGFNADLIDFSVAESAASPVGRLILRIGGKNVLLAWTCFRRSKDYAAIVTDGEQVGIPYAALSWLLPRRRRPTHSMIVHVLSVRKKVLVYRALGLRHRVDRLFVYSTAQRDFATRELHMPPTAVSLTSFMVDSRFFDPACVASSPRRMICTAGLEFRDYDTLTTAVAGLDVEVVVAAASPWSKRTTSIADTTTPDNIRVVKLDLLALRQLYADSLFVVMPLQAVDFQAGVTTILEAMSMAKSVICSRTSGQTDVIEDEVTGLYVAPQDAAALRGAIVRLLDDPVLAERLGEKARQWVVRVADLDVYAERLGSWVADDVASRGCSPMRGRAGRGSSARRRNA